MECVAWKGVESVPGLVEELGALVEQHPWAELANGAMMHFFQPEQPAEALRRIQSPVLVMVGELEMPAYRECADILERNLPDVRRVELPQTHHLCMLESPELAAPPIEQHLREFAKKSKRLAH